MAQKQRLIVVLDFIGEDIPREFELSEGGVLFRIVWHSIGWNHATAREILKRMDGTADAFCFCGIREKVGFGTTEFDLKSTDELIEGIEHTPVYFGQEFQRIFGNWALQRIEREHHLVFKGKKVLFHSVAFTPFADTFLELGAKISGADPLAIFRVPVRLRGEVQIRAFLQTLPYLAGGELSRARPNFYRSREASLRKQRLGQWISESDVFVTYARLLDYWVDFEQLRGKILITDWLSPEQRERVRAAGVCEAVEIAPHLQSLEPLRRSSFSLLTAMLDLIRIAENSPASLRDYALEYIEENHIALEHPRFATPLPRKCAFVLHPLTRRQLVSAKPFRWWLPRLPKTVLGPTEKVLTHLPVQHVGTMRGVRSALNGQEVVCELYAVVATARMMREMREEHLYRKLAAVAERAHSDGAVLMGLGAYTKVVGDSGITVARRSPIPVTTGNSLSAAATLWAAREGLKRLGMLKLAEPGKKTRGKAMVIGATGAIGRVSALILAQEFETIVVVAPRPEKLLELRDEIEEISPGTHVIMRTSADSDLQDTDLIITATSVPGGRILDIMKVKPGAVISDVSRPLNITADEAALRRDVLAIESGEVVLPGEIQSNFDMGLPGSAQYACVAETILLTMEGRYESFSLSRHLSRERVTEIEEIARKHGARLAPIQSPLGPVTDERIAECRALALERLKTWEGAEARPPRGRRVRGG